MQAPAAGDRRATRRSTPRARSVVKVLGTACGLGVEGSGWVAGDGLVVTNAHVVAGQDDTRVLLRGPRARASTRRRSPSTRATTSRCCGSRALRAPALPLAAVAARRHARPRSSASRATAPTTCAPAGSGETREVVTQDAYGRGPVRRLITSLRGAVRSGNSGGPMVDGARPRGDDDLRRDHVRAARRLRRAQRRRALDARRGARAGLDRARAPAEAPRAGPLPSAAMAKTLVIAEKPSVGRDLTRALPGQFAKHEGYLESDDARVTWAVGHLVQLAEPDEYDAKYKKWRMADLPIVPDDFRLVVRDERSRKQMTVITRLLQRKDVDEVVNACDAGREGELIFAWTVEKAGIAASPSSACGCPR